jgi:hypothetical protein
MDHARAARRVELAATLRALDERFARDLRAHGFEPAQAETVALPGPLAELYAAREEMRAELAELIEDAEG